VDVDVNAKEDVVFLLILLPKILHVLPLPNKPIQLIQEVFKTILSQ